jgi:signal transduction histidine kinase
VTQRTTEVVAPGRPRIGRPGLGGSLAYLFCAQPFSLITSIPLLVLSVAGIGTTIVWVGIPIMMATTTGWRAAARMERKWMRTILKVDIPTPYRSLPPGSLFRRWRAKVTDPATWRDIAYLVVRLPLCLLDFLFVAVFWVYSLALVVLPFWAPALPADDGVNLPNLHFQLVQVHTASQALPYSGVGLVVLLLAILLTPQLARFQAAFARSLLGPTAAARLTVTAERLHASRARGVDAAEAERRRIERDLHDGAQQRLVAVAMALGRAKTKLDDDPTSARALIDEAHADAKQAIAELRDLARGIYPAVLGDRGLDAALSALAARCPVPVEVTVHVTPRPPTAVESTAYFIVAEALTNVAKHSTATTVLVAVVRDGDTVTVTVADDGGGGAELRPGGGLAGLADRAATIDGVMTVTSPQGGPTMVTAELPCVW